MLEKVFGRRAGAEAVHADEFAIVQTQIGRPEDVVLLAKRLLDVVSQPYLFNGHSVVIGASIGIAVAVGGGLTTNLLLQYADMALYAAKRAAAKKR